MNFKQQAFITEYLRHRSAFTAYCLAYNVKDESKFESIMSAANRLLNDPKVGGVIDSVLSGIRHDVEQEIRAKLRTDMLTTQRKREILAKIATGEMYAVQVYKGKDCSQCTQHVWPTINQMLKAIDLDNKMVGLYTTTRVGDKPQLAPTLNAQVGQQVDNLLESMGLTIEEDITLSPLEENRTPSPLAEDITLSSLMEDITPSPLVERGQGGEVNLPENCNEIPTKGNKNTTDVTHQGIDKETENNIDDAPSGVAVKRQQNTTVQGSPFMGWGT